MTGIRYRTPPDDERRRLLHRKTDVRLRLPECARDLLGRRTERRRGDVSGTAGLNEHLHVFPDGHADLAAEGLARDVAERRLRDDLGVSAFDLGAGAAGRLRVVCAAATRRQTQQHRSRCDCGCRRPRQCRPRRPLVHAVSFESSRSRLPHSWIVEGTRRNRGESKRIGWRDVLDLDDRPQVDAQSAVACATAEAARAGARSAFRSPFAPSPSSSRSTTASSRSLMPAPGLEREKRARRRQRDDRHAGQPRDGRAVHDDQRTAVGDARPARRPPTRRRRRDATRSSRTCRTIAQPRSGSTRRSPRTTSSGSVRATTWLRRPNFGGRPRLPRPVFMSKKYT